ncbi:Rv3654c family TadE-like protein [Nocardia sp. AG03]|uniref:Rv3654c family TadE-like protein n=1 Tax=Nocardia sp. AG03 TaxID=3025312 RepID=UPI0024185610|nr:Rv3654c family TadE-like protein [Nocardia sp. AG03]
MAQTIHPPGHGRTTDGGKGRAVHQASRPDRWARVRRGAEADRGGATAFACFALAGLIAVTLLVGNVGAVVVARHRAQAGADLAALAAAGRLVEGADAGCAMAGEVAGRMGVRVGRCAVEQWDVVVVVRTEVAFGAFGRRAVVATARAGPVDESG